MTDSGEAIKPRPIESLSLSELRAEAEERVSLAFNSFQASPLVDGSGIFGFQREEQELPSLTCIYVQYAREPSGSVTVNLRDIIGASLYLAHQHALERELRQTNPLSETEREEFQAFIERFRTMQNGIAKDGIAYEDHRSYLIPKNPSIPVFISTASNEPRDNKSTPKRESNAPEQAIKVNVDPLTNQPRSRAAKLQDYRDLLMVVRQSDYLVREVVRSHISGRR